MKLFKKMSKEQRFLNKVEKLGKKMDIYIDSTSDLMLTNKYGDPIQRIRYYRESYRLAR